MLKNEQLYCLQITLSIVLITLYLNSFRNIKDYYNDITRGNLEKIRDLKEEKKKLEQNQIDHKIAIEDLKKENETLKNPLEDAKAELSKLEDKLTNYNLDKVSLFNAKKHLKTLAYQLEKRKYSTLICLKCLILLLL